MQPLQIPKKSPFNASDSDGEGDDWSFGNMMHMMRMQKDMDNERKEQQYKNELNQRGWEFQLHCKEMAISREKAHEQWKMMNLMFIKK